MKDKILGMYRTFKHNILYKDRYYNKVLRICLLGLLICICMIFLLG